MAPYESHSTPQSPRYAGVPPITFRIAGPTSSGSQLVELITLQHYAALKFIKYNKLGRTKVAPLQFTAVIVLVDLYPNKRLSILADSMLSVL